jgi:hypothetical protein
MRHFEIEPDSYRSAMKKDQFSSVHQEYPHVLDCPNYRICSTGQQCDWSWEIPRKQDGIIAAFNFWINSETVIRPSPSRPTIYWIRRNCSLTAPSFYIFQWAFNSLSQLLLLFGRSVKLILSSYGTFLKRDTNPSITNEAYHSCWFLSAQMPDSLWNQLQDLSCSTKSKFWNFRLHGLAFARTIEICPQWNDKKREKQAARHANLQNDVFAQRVDDFLVLNNVW